MELQYIRDELAQNIFTPTLVVEGDMERGKIKNSEDAIRSVMGSGLVCLHVDEYEQTDEKYYLFVARHTPKENIAFSQGDWTSGETRWGFAWFADSSIQRTIDNCGGEGSQESECVEIVVSNIVGAILWGEDDLKALALHFRKNQFYGFFKSYKDQEFSDLGKRFSMRIEGLSKLRGVGCS